MTTFTSEDRENAVKNNASQKTFDALQQRRIVAEAPYHPGYEDAVIAPEHGRPSSQVIRDSMRARGKRFWARVTRGHHYHKEFDEYIMLVEGERIYLELLDAVKVRKIVIGPGQTIHLPKLTPHTFVPLTDCKSVSFLNSSVGPLSRTDNSY